jgi:hypothetical protein
MRYLIVFSGILFATSSGLLHADCVDRVVATQQRLSEVVGELSPAQQTEVNALLLNLCELREPGASVVHAPDRNVITTHGLNERQSATQAQDTTVVVGVDASPRHYYPRKPERPQRPERVRKPLKTE